MTNTFLRLTTSFTDSFYFDKEPSKQINNKNIYIKKQTTKKKQKTEILNVGSFNYFVF